MRETEMPGISAFLRVGDEVFHTYSTFGRGIEEFHNGYPWLDLTALGRQEEWEEPQGRADAAGAAGRRCRPCGSRTSTTSELRGPGQSSDGTGWTSSTRSAIESTTRVGR